MSTQHGKTDAIMGADIISEAIYKHQDVDHVFFVDAVLRHVLMDLETRGVKRILAHSEKSAAYMADGYARASGKTGICMAQAVGAVNLAAGLQDAFLDRVPILAMTGRKPDTHQHRNAYQEVPHRPAYEPVTKFTAEVRDVNQLPRLLGHALHQCRTQTNRPVHLDLDGLKGNLVEEVEYTGPRSHLDFIARRQSIKMSPNTEALSEAADRLTKAQRPMIVCGVTSLYSRAGDGIKALAEKHDIPIATSVGGRTVVETNHPNHFGVVGTYSAPYANRYLAQADLVIYVGCHMGDQISCDWTIPSPGTPIIQIDADAAELGRTSPNALGLAGDLETACLALAKATEAKDRSQWLSECISAARDWLAQAVQKAHTAQGLIPAERLAHDVGEVLPENAILVADTGFSATWTAQLTEFRHSEQTYLRAAGSLGWAYPAALGAACGSGGRPTVCFTGDGAFFYHMGELETQRRWQIPLVTIVNNNSALGQGLRTVKKLHENRDGNLSDLVEFSETNFANLAEIFGIKGYRVEKAEDIQPTIAEAIAKGEPAVVDVVTDPDSNPEPAWLG